VVLELVLLAALGVRLRPFLVRSAVVVVGAGLTAVTILLYGQPSGTVHWHFLLANVSDGSIALSVATFLRVLAIALPMPAAMRATSRAPKVDGRAHVLHG
jgi:energy-coupling factor transport system permease protein